MDAAAYPFSPSELRVAVVSQRPAVHAFFRDVANVSDNVSVALVELAPADSMPPAPALDRASVVVIDISLELASGIDLCSELHASRPSLPLLALVCCPQNLSAWHVEAMLEGVVSGVLDLQSTAEEVWRTLEHLSQGASVLHLHVQQSELSFLRRLVASRDLTRVGTVRLLELLALGLPDHELGRRLHVSPHTVKHHIEALREELGMRNRIELAAWAGRHGFYAPERTVPATKPSPPVTSRPGG